MTFDLHLQAPHLSARVSREVVASTLARLVASGAATSKAELARVTGLSRTTVDAGVRTLLDIGALRVHGTRSVPGRGRPAQVLGLHPGFALVLVADCGSTHASLGLFDLGQRLISQTDVPLRIKAGPEKTLGDLVGAFSAMIEGCALQSVPRSLVIGLPGPVDHVGGTVVRPPIMPGWDGYPIVERLRESISGPVVLENDVNLRAIGEARKSPPTHGPLLYVKVGTGIGVGIVAGDGTLLRGADGAAGDVGHVRVSGSAQPCACGKTGCLEAVASVHAIGVALGLVDERQADLTSTVTQLVQKHDARAVELVRRSAESIGEVAANLVHFLNPERLVVGGTLSMLSDDFLAIVRSAVYSRALPLATRALTIGRPMLGSRSGLAGGLAIAIESSLESAAISDRIAESPGAPRRNAFPAGSRNTAR